MPPVPIGTCDEPSRNGSRGEIVTDGEMVLMRLLGDPRRPWLPDAGSETRLRSATVVVNHPCVKNSPVPFSQRDHPIQTLVANCPARPFAIGVCGVRPGGEAVIAFPVETARRRVPRERLA
jgi:hypothetical protein